MDPNYWCHLPTGNKLHIAYKEDINAQSPGKNATVLVVCASVLILSRPV